MKYFLLFTLFFLITVLSCNTVQKAENKTAVRIVSLSPNITEIIYALGQQDKIIAVSDFCTYPDQTSTKEHIGGLLNPNMEKIASLNADLFIGTPAHFELSKKLDHLHLRSVLLSNDRLQDIFTAIDSIGILLKCREAADSLSRSIKDSLAFYQKKTNAFSKHPSTLLVIGREPGSARKIMVAGPNTFLNEIWEMNGGRNAFPELSAKYAQISTEALLKNNPDLIIEFKFKEKWDDKKNRINQSEWNELNQLTAVRDKQIYVLNGDYTLIPGPRIYLLARDYYTILRRAIR